MFDYGDIKFLTDSFGDLRVLDKNDADGFFDFNDLQATYEYLDALGYLTQDQILGLLIFKASSLLPSNFFEKALINTLKTAKGEMEADVPAFLSEIYDVFKEIEDEDISSSICDLFFSKYLNIYDILDFSKELAKSKDRELVRLGISTLNDIGISLSKEEKDECLNLIISCKDYERAKVLSLLMTNKFLLIHNENLKIARVVSETNINNYDEVLDFLSNLKAVKAKKLIDNFYVKINSFQQEELIEENTEKVIVPENLSSKKIKAINFLTKTHSGSDGSLERKKFYIINARETQIEAIVGVSNIRSLIPEDADVELMGLIFNLPDDLIDRVHLHIQGYLSLYACSDKFEKSEELFVSIKKSIGEFVSDSYYNRKLYQGILTKK